MAYFKSLRYDTRSAEEKKQIEDTLVAKMEKWKNSPNELKEQVLDVIPKEIAPIWENAINVAKYIRE